MAVVRAIQIGPPANQSVSSTPNDAVGLADSATADLVTAGTITHGRQISAANTGIAKWGLTTANLTAFSGSLVAGTTYYRRRITSGITIDQPNVTFDQCLFDPPGDAASPIIGVDASGFVLRDCTLKPSSGSRRHGVTGLAGGSGLLITGCDISFCVNNINLEDWVRTSTATIEYSYCHDSSNASNPGDHRDCIEIYSGDSIMIRKCKLTHPADETSVINAVPFNEFQSVTNLTVEDCYLDGGNMHYVIGAIYSTPQSNASTTYVKNMKCKRNDQGGHTAPFALSGGGRYWTANLANGVTGFTDSLAAQVADDRLVYFPMTGGDVSHWVDCSDLSPDKSGQIVDPSNPTY
jgi:hypothetical protein